MSTGAARAARRASAAVRTARSYDARASRPRPRRPDHGLPAVAAPAAGAARPARRRRAPAAPRRGSPSPASSAGQVLGDLQRVAAPSDASTPRTCAAGSSTAVSVRRRRPLGALGGRGERVGAGAASRLLAEPLEVALPHPAGGRELVGVPGDAGRGQLVDVGEDQLGEPRHRRRRRGRPRRRRRTARARPPGRRPGRPRAARPSSGRCAPRPGPARRRPPARAERGAGVGAAAAAGQPEEAAEGQLHGRLDVGAHRPGERVGVAGHLGDHRRDGLRRRPRAAARAARATTGSSRSSAAAPRAVALGTSEAINCSLRTNSAATDSRRTVMNLAPWPDMMDA